MRRTTRDILIAHGIRPADSQEQVPPIMVEIWEEAYSQGLYDGFGEGYREGCDEGYDIGREAGFAVGCNSVREAA